MANIPQLSG